MHGLDHDRPLADGGGHALDGTAADIPDRKNAGQAALERRCNRT